MSNKYCQALVEQRNKPAHELKEVGDQWRTPDNIFWGINTLFGPFVLDLFTDGDNAKCAAYYTAEDNALAHDWSERLAELKGAAFGKALRLPKPVVPSVSRESDLVPSVPATSIIQDKAKKVLALKVDPESPESFMLRPKRRRWVNEKYTRWVKTQPCACCGKPADDPHHLIGHGQGGMGTKAHDLFVLPLCRKHHDELHADTVAFEEKYGSQLELIFRFIDRALAIGVLA
ncbi:phage N-6-adenine-methyltransferase [Escherichia coli]|nr:phage N-6-adenine-methyltransferase [Escherichia coli]